MQPFSFSSEQLWSAWIPPTPLPNPHGVFRCRPLPVAATRVGISEAPRQFGGFCIFFTASPKMSSSSATASRIRLALFPPKAFSFFFFLVQPQHHCALNPVIFICLDSDTTADAKYIAQVDTLTILPFFITLMWGKKKTLFNLVFKQLSPFPCFCSTLSYYLFLRVPRMFRYLGHNLPLRSCLLASWVFCVQLCAFALLLARIVLRVADGPRRR